MHEQGLPWLSHQRLGGQVLQASLGHDRHAFYLSPIQDNQASAGPTRGGVPVLFPQFANLGPGRKHGFARHVLWEAVEHHDSPQQADSCCLYQLSIAPHDHDDWPHTAELRIQTRASRGLLQMEMQVLNTGDTAFEWTGGLHPYWAVGDLVHCRLHGLQGATGYDNLAQCTVTQTNEALRWNGRPCEQLYEGGTELWLDCGSHQLALKATGFTQWMVWNPGEEGGRALTDLPAEEWRRFVCVEPVCASRPIHLLPGEQFVGTLSVELIKVTGKDNNECTWHLMQRPC